MRKKETPPILLYSLSDERVNKIVDDYLDFVTNPYHEWRQRSDWNEKEISCFFCSLNREEAPELRPLKERSEFDNRPEKYSLKYKPRREKTELKFRAIIDMLYRLYTQSKSDWFTISRWALTEVFYDGVPYMLFTLLKHNVINWTDTYSYVTIPHPDWFTCTAYKYAASVVPYRERVKQIIYDYNRKNRSPLLNKIIGSSTNSFFKQYEQNIGLLQFSDIEGLSSFMSNPDNFKEIDKETGEVIDRPHRHIVYQSVIDRISLSNGYTSKDKQQIIVGKKDSISQIGRFYHIGTSLPKMLKPYTNILYGIDSHNSHPLLFNYMILNYYLNDKALIDYDFSFSKIDNSNLFYNISLFINNTNTYLLPPYVMKNLCNYLINNKIISKKRQMRKIPQDALQYIRDTSTGVIWKIIQQSFPDYTRDEIKENVFQNVFYSPSIKTGYYDTENDTYVEAKKKKWVDMFRQKYPSVMRLINVIKKDLHNQCVANGLVDSEGKDKIQLPHLLMRFESVIFTRALNDAFKANIPAIGIHDCIAVIGDTIDMDQQQQLKDILLNRYKECGLIPSLSVEVYH